MVIWSMLRQSDAFLQVLYEKLLDRQFVLAVSSSEFIFATTSNTQADKEILIKAV